MCRKNKFWEKKKSFQNVFRDRGLGIPGEFGGAEIEGVEKINFGKKKVIKMSTVNEGM